MGHLFPFRTTELSRRRLFQVGVGAAGFAAGLSSARQVFGAATAGTAPSSGSGLIRDRAPNQFHIFDLHHHVTVPGLEMDKDIARRLAFMDANSIEQCLLMPPSAMHIPMGLPIRGSSTTRLPHIAIAIPSGFRSPSA